MSISSIIKRAGKFIIRGVPNVHISSNISYLNPYEKLKGKKILISGGSRGLGYAMAKKFISEGAKVVITGRNEDLLRQTSSKINCRFIVHNVKDVNSHANLIRTAEQMMEGINCLVNNAGISLHESSFLEVTNEQFDSQFDVNLKGTYFLTQAFIRHLLSKKDMGTILIVSSERGETCEVLPYGLTKAALSSFTKGLAARYIKYGIRVNGIAPGVTASEMTGFDPAGNLYCDYNITKRVYLPEEVAEIASFLVSDVSIPLNGQILVCNEGKTINI